MFCRHLCESRDKEVIEPSEAVRTSAHGRPLQTRGLSRHNLFVTSQFVLNSRFLSKYNLPIAFKMFLRVLKLICVD